MYMICKAILQVGLVTAMVFTACQSATNPTTASDSSAMARNDSEHAFADSLKPVGPKPAWAPDIKYEMQVVIDRLASYGDPPIETLTPQKARRNHTPADAVRDVLKEHNIPIAVPRVDTLGKDIPVVGGTEHIRIYTPKDGSGPFPVIVYYHGGGWVIADINTYNASAQAMAEQTGSVVISVNYRQGPEYKFPTAHNDAFAAYQWALQNAGSIKGDPKKMAVVGESAGGNLACAVSMLARDKGVMVPLYQVLVYPISGSDTTTASYQKNAMAKPLNRSMMVWFFKNYLHNMEEGKDTRITLINANLKGLPPTTIIGAELDPLMSEGKMLADKLREAGVKVNYKLFDGVTHEFFGMSTVVPEAKEAQGIASSDLKGALK